MMRMEPLSEHVGTVIRADRPDPEALFSLDRAEVIERFRSTGAVVFRGFAADSTVFERFAGRFSVTDKELHPSLHGHVRDVFTGRGFLGPHAELTYLPWPPDILWFWCSRPAVAGGRTTVYDGVRFLAELDPDLEHQFRARKLMFSQFFSPEGWPKFFGRTREQLTALYEQWGMTYSFDKRNCLSTRYTVSAIKRTKFGGQDAFVNTLVHALDDSRFYGMTFDDGSKISSEVASRLRELAQRLVVPIEWTAGDIAMIDNTRMMHGREAYTDDERLVKALEAMAAFS